VTTQLVNVTPKLVAELDHLTFDELVTLYGQPQIVTEYAQGVGYWAPGQSVPPLHDDDPAVAQAIGRCLASRIRSGLADFGLPRADEFHPAECGWCAYSKADLLRACDYATWRSRFIVAEHATWRSERQPPDSRGKYLRSYVRSTNRSGEYDNPAWAAFFQGATPAGELMPPSDREFARARRRAAIAEAAEYAK
jgi:hypothetical protein